MRWANRAATVALALVLALLALGAGLRVAGLTPLVERSDSMAPAIATGDLLLVRGVPVASLRPDAIVTLEDPLGGRLLTHRVASVAREAGGRVALVTRGDANASVERWVLREDATVQRMATSVAAAGQPLLWLSSPLPRMLLALLGAGLLTTALLRRIWGGGGSGAR